MRCHLVLAALLCSCLSPAALAQARSAATLRLVPFPKEVRLQAGTLALNRRLVLEAPADSAALLGELVATELSRAGLPAPEVRPIQDSANRLRLTPPGSRSMSMPAPPATGGPEAYALQVRAEGALVSGAGPAGLFYGVQTLCQLIRANRQGQGIPCLAIRDWPSLRWRCFQDDLTRGPSSTLAELKRQADLGAHLKLNLFTYYMEHQYAFKKHPLIPPADGALLPEELAALVEYVRPLGMDVLGNQQSFGHFNNILCHEQYQELAETSWILSPVNEKSYQLLDDLYSEVVPLLPLPFFNVCCDETQGLGEGPSKALAQQIGVGGVYAGHVRRIHDLLKEKYGKRMMMWGDIILTYPENLKEIPTDTIMLTWAYDPRANFESQIEPFAKSGYEFFVCPGVNNWSRILPDFAATLINIRNFVRDGAKHGALGMLNTSWDDDGETLNAPNWHGYAWGAECAWNAATTSPEAFQRRIGAVLFGEKGDHFGQAITLLGQTHGLPGAQGMINNRFWQLDLGPVPTHLAAEQEHARRLLKLVRPAIAHLEACRRQATLNTPLLDAFLFGARRMELIGQRVLDHLEASRAYQEACELPRERALPLLAKAEALLRRNRDAHAALGREFAALWHRENRPYALDPVLKRYENAVAQYDSLLTRLATIREAAAAGSPLPSPKEAGLELIELGVRRTHPHRVESTPLRADAPWLVPASSRRLGLVIAAGSADRLYLPVEVDIRIPAGLARKPVRAFWLAEGAAPQEIPAQLDRSRAPGRTRLTLVLSGLLPQGTTAPIHVYLGASEGAALPQAVSTRKAPKGATWIENDQVRLLLAPEGAHLSRWEGKALGGRDLTMPGESDYSGFADTGGEHRKAPNRLVCTARGPALVRYVCKDPLGLEKTISVFAGLAAAEVALNSPSGYFWAFDDPKNFAADGPTPGTYLFSTGATGAVGKEADTLAAQVRAPGATWGAKYRPGEVLLGMITPDTPALHVVAPGAGAGGAGIEGTPPAGHFVLYGGPLEGDPALLMNRLQATFDYRNQPEVVLYGAQAKR